MIILHAEFFSTAIEFSVIFYPDQIITYLFTFYSLIAIASTSIATSFGSFATCTQDLAGYGATK